MQISPPANRSLPTPKICKAQTLRPEDSQILIPRVSAHPCFLQRRFIWQISLCYLKKKSKETASQEKKFPFPFQVAFIWSHCSFTGLLTAKSRSASESSVLCLHPPARIPLLCSSHGASPTPGAPSCRESPHPAPKVLQTTVLNFRTGSDSSHRENSTRVPAKKEWGETKNSHYASSWLVHYQLITCHIPNFLSLPLLNFHWRHWLDLSACSHTRRNSIKPTR